MTVLRYRQTQTVQVFLTGDAGARPERWRAVPYLRWRSVGQSLVEETRDLNSEGEDPKIQIKAVE